MIIANILPIQKILIIYSMNIPNFEDIVFAKNKINKFINKTPVLTCSTINKLTNANIFFKCENFQKVGAFKYRGATNAILSLDKDSLKNGVATHSSGNHAAALALAAKLQNIKSYIVMPNNAPKIKIDAVKGYGGNIIFCEPTLKAREENLNKIVEETGANFIHPYNNENVIKGQGTACLELIEEIPNIDTIIAPVGGGGLLSGTSIAAKGFNNKIKVFGAEPLEANDAYLSFKSKKLILSNNPKTIADGLLTSLSDLTFSIILKNVDNILTCSEDQIKNSMRLIWERMKIIIEPSSAVTLAIVLNNPEIFKNKKIGLIISGGNVDIDNLPF